MLRSVAIVLSSAAIVVACGDGDSDQPNRPGTGAVAAQRPPRNAQAPTGDPQRPENRSNAPENNPAAPLPNPQAPPPEVGSGGTPPSGGDVVGTCRASCARIAGTCGGGCQEACNGIRRFLTACQREVAAFFDCFGQVGIECDGSDVNFPSTQCVSRLLQNGQISAACLIELQRDL